jgi:hypothetical protein
MPQTIDSLTFTQNLININSINLLIEKNAKCIKKLYLNNIYLSSEILEKISKNMDLEEFAFCCQIISIRELVDLAKYHNNLNLLSITSSYVNSFGAISGHYFDKSHTFELISCNLRAESMRNVLKLFPKLKTLNIKNNGLECDCVTALQKFGCDNCLKKFYEFLAETDIKSLFLNQNDIKLALIHVLNGFENFAKY